MSAMIRPAAAADLSAVAAIYAHHVVGGLATFDTEPPGLADWQARLHGLAARGLPFLVAESVSGQAHPSGHPILGYAYAAPYRSREAYGLTLEDSVYLWPEAAGQGLGVQLLDALVRAAEAWGARQMVAVIGDSANHASIRAHLKAGFTHVGVLKSVGWKHGRWIDTVLMQRPLGLSDAAPPRA